MVSQPRREALPLASYAVDASAAAVPRLVAEQHLLTNARAATESEVYSKLQEPHLHASADAITAAVDYALEHTPQDTPSTAIVLGNGNCLGIPLDKLAASFDRLTIVGVVTAHTEAALRKLPPYLLEKISLVRADVTGTAAPLIASADRLASYHSSRYGFIGAINKAIGKLVISPNNQPDLGGGYDFACSHLLASQLPVLPLRHVFDLLRKKYGHDFSDGPGNADADLALAMRAYTNNIQTAHVRQLASLVANTGVVHFADTTSEYVSRKKILVVTPSVIDETRTWFDRLQRDTTWEWQPRPARRLSVLSMALAPKQPAA